MELRDIKREYLGHGDIDSDINILIRHVMGDVSISPFLSVPDSIAKVLRKYISRHLKGEPIEKIIGYSIFCDCYIQYSRHTLTPRLETELLVEAVKEYVGEKCMSVLDMCCGSGAIGIALAKSANCRVLCADISKKVLKMCASNARINNVNVEIIQSDLFDNIKERYDVIVCNPPYIPYSEYLTLDDMVKKYDPKLALVADKEGLAIYERIAESVTDYLTDSGILVLEIGYNQGDRVKAMLDSRFRDVEVSIDYNGNDRIVIARDIRR